MKGVGREGEVRTEDVDARRCCLDMCERCACGTVSMFEGLASVHSCSYNDTRVRRAEVRITCLEGVSVCREVRACSPHPLALPYIDPRQHQP